MVDPALFAELRDLCLRSFPERLGQRLSHVEVIDSTVEVIDSAAEPVHLQKWGEIVVGRRGN